MKKKNEEAVINLSVGKKPISYDEYVKIQNRADGWKAQGTEEEFVQGFGVFDRDGNGLISAGELRYGKN